MIFYKVIVVFCGTPANYQTLSDCSKAQSIITFLIRKAITVKKKRMIYSSNL